MKAEELNFILQLAITISTVVIYIHRLEKKQEHIKRDLAILQQEHEHLQARYDKRGQRYIRAFRALKEHCIKTNTLVENNWELCNALSSDLEYLYSKSNLRKPSSSNRIKASKLPNFDTLNELDDIENEFVDLQTFLK